MEAPQILADDTIQKRLASLDVAWTAIGNDYLIRSFETKTFDEGVDLIDKIAVVAAKHNHHPDVHLSYSRVEVRISTHSVAGITNADFELAAAIDQFAK